MREVRGGKKGKVKDGSRKSEIVEKEEKKRIGRLSLCVSWEAERWRGSKMSNGQIGKKVKQPTHK